MMTMPYKPTDGMQTEAQRGLDWREEYGRGGTEIGLGRARDIVAGRQLSEDVVKRMYSFFSRHEVDKQAEGFSPGEDGYPSNGRIAWALWGGDAGFSWSREKVKSMEENRAAPDALKTGDFVEWNSSGGKARGQIERIVREGTLSVPDTDFTLDATEENPAALIRLFREGEETDTLVGHRFSTLTKIAGIRSSEEINHQLNDGDFNGIPSEETNEEVQVPEEVEATEERKAPVEVLHRAIDMAAKSFDEKKRTVDIAVSSELAVDRSFGKEILVHESGAIDMGFVASGRAPLLLDHDPERQIGVIESVELSGDRVLRAKVRFGRSALAQEVFQDVVDGIRSNVSVGYRVNKMERSTTNKDEYLVRSWSPLEVSVVSIPADPSVGVGRSAAALEPKPTIEPSIKKEVKMTDEVNLDAVRAEAAEAAARNASAIVELAARHNKRDLGDAALRSGKSIEQFRGELLDVIGSDKPLANEDIGLTKKEIRQFSVVRAIAALANPSDRRLREAAAFEFEVSEAAAARYGRGAQGVMLPTDILGVWKRDLNTSDDNEIVATNLLANEFIDVLRNSSSVMQAGARMLPGLQGNVAIPKKTAASASGWISTEGGAAGESEPTFGTVSMTPKNIGAFTDMTRQLILQSTPAIEQLVRDDLTQSLALAIDKGALEGTGLNGQPTGILSTVGVNKPTAFAAAVPTFAEMVALETAVAEDNALFGNLAYITDAATYGGLKTKAKDAGSGMFVLEGGQANGYNVIRTQQATAGNVYFGNFQDCMIGMWGGLDLTVDPYTASTTGTVRIVALQTVDVALRNAVSFAYNNDTV
ncbi:phage major capsid protein [Microcoleus sp. PH2017_29_MFU_D_A]|uniref:phage major capsid protein n=1 Tax=Microcoleus sp. PH2017_29_MFU_D_A TaxID=2798839 RepID=UPI0025D70F9C|nr:phage major capsid protein [Microcoleus sp. PH2017_29_MFU_D_A]